MAVKHGSFMLTHTKGSRRPNQCLRKFIRISYFNHKTIDCLQSKIHFIVGPKEPLLATGKKQNVAWFGYAIRHAGLFKTILHGTLDGDGCRAHARTAHNGFLQKRLEEDLCLIVLNWTDLTWTHIVQAKTIFIHLKSVEINFYLYSPKMHYCMHWIYTFSTPLNHTITTYNH